MIEDMDPILALLNATLGLDPHSIGLPLLKRMVAERVRARDCRSTQEYQPILRGEPDELAALVELVVVPETWFFRDMDAFVPLQQRVRESPGKRPFRVLSAPCSSGEEPCSIALALLQAGLVPEDIRITAVDISALALARAQRAVYGPASFRQGLPAPFQDYFLPVPDGLTPDQRVRETITFGLANLVQDEFWKDLTGFEAIFCRNLLIYLDQAHKTALLKQMAHALWPDGLLFVSSAEAMPLLLEQFEPVGRAGALAYTPRSPSDRAAAPGTPLARPAPKARRTPPHAPAQADHESLATSGKPEARPVPLDLLAEARKWADQGRLQEAAEQCSLLLARHAPSADLYLLLGEIHQAMDQTALAEECFRKALYLDPNQGEALAHMALLAESRQDPAKARRLRQRLERTKGGTNGQART